VPKCPFCDFRNSPSAKTCEKCGGPLPNAGLADDLSLEEQLRSVLDRGEKAGAISLYREQTGAGQQDASDAVDAFEQGEPLPSLPEVEAGLEEEILALLQSGKRIQAVKAYREQTGSTLKHAARAVDALAAEHGIAVKGGGCAGATLMILAVACLAARHFLQA